MGKDIYAEVTDRIIAELENGIIPWRRPWIGHGGAISHESGRPYSFLNQMLLGRPGEYITWNQAKKEGGNVKKGAKSKIIVFWKPIVKPVLDVDGNPVIDAYGQPEIRVFPCLKYYNVFHIDDCENIAPKWKDKPAATAETLEEPEAVFHDYITREKIGFDECISDKAYYAPGMDYIHLPLKTQFPDTAEYYSTMFHETVHSTGHAKRLNRFSKNALDNIFGSESYSKEELVAEIGAACTLSRFGIETGSSFKNSTAYIQSWLRALKNDKTLIVSAAAKAEKAVKLIFNEKAEEAENAA